MKQSSLKILTVSIVASLMLLYVGCGNSMSRTPEQVVTDYYQSINEKNCDTSVDLSSSNFNYGSGASRDEEIKACQRALQGNHPLASVKIIEVVINDNKAVVKEELTFSTSTKQKTNKDIAYLVIEDGEWKIDKIDSDDSQFN